MPKGIEELSDGSILIYGYLCTQESGSSCAEEGFIARFDSEGNGPTGHYATRAIGGMVVSDITSSVSVVSPSVDYSVMGSSLTPEAAPY